MLAKCSAVLASVTLVLALVAPAALSQAKHQTPPSVAGHKTTYVTNDCRHVKARPQKIVFACADFNFYVTNLPWWFWGLNWAAGQGRFHQNDCKPNCAAGTFHQRNGKLLLTEPRLCSGINKWVFTKVRIHYNRPLVGRHGAALTLGCPLPLRS